MDCVFCEIVAGSASAIVVWEDPTTMAFLDIAPSADGHTLVVPKVHATDVWDIDADALADVARAVHAVAALLQDRIAPEGLTIVQNNRSAGWQDVFHLHFHVIPRASGDRLVRPWVSERATDDHLRHVHAQLTGKTGRSCG